MANSAPVLNGKDGTVIDAAQRFIDATTNNLIIDLAKVQMNLKAKGSALQRLRKSVGDNKKLRDGIIDELTKRAIDENSLELPLGYTMESLFSKANVDEEDAE